MNEYPVPTVMKSDLLPHVFSHKLHAGKALQKMRWKSEEVWCMLLKATTLKSKIPSHTSIFIEQAIMQTFSSALHHLQDLGATADIDFINIRALQGSQNLTHN